MRKAVRAASALPGVKQPRKAGAPDARQRLRYASVFATERASQDRFRTLMRQDLLLDREMPALDQ